MTESLGSVQSYGDTAESTHRAGNFEGWECWANNIRSLESQDWWEKEVGCTVVVHGTVPESARK